VKRFVAALLMIGATAAYTWLNPPVNLALGGARLAACPTTLGDWTGTALSFEDAVVEELRADDLLIRRYARGAETVWLCVVYHENRRYGAHDPTVCYESQGYLVAEEGGHRVAGARGPLEANRFVAERSRDRRLVYYWWSTQGLDTRDADAFRRRMAVTGALENRSWGAFVRVETVIEGDDVAGAERRLEDFARAAAQGLDAVFTGDAATAGTGPAGAPVAGDPR
jgi:EpsI family protein